MIKKYYDSLAGATLMLLSFLIIFLFFMGNIKYYLQPLFQYLSIISSILLFMVGLILTVLKKLNPKDCYECNDIHSIDNENQIFIFSILLIVFYLAAMISPNEFSVTVLENRGVSRLASSQTNDNLERNFTQNKDGNYILEITDILNSINNNESISKLNKNKIEVVGQFMNNISGEEIILVRMLMFCCAADARPIGIALESKDKYALNDSTWVSVIGTIQIRDKDNFPVILVDNITQTTKPDEPMLRYNLFNKI